MHRTSIPAGLVRAAGGTLLSIGLLTPLAAQEPARIETLMSEVEQQQSGISELSAEQLRALNDWLGRNMTLRPEAAGASQANAVAPPQAPAAAQESEQRGYGEREEIADVVSSIKGEFTGWDGKTVFRLENGQVYQQRRPGRWKTQLQNPEVRIEKGFIGYNLIVEDHSIGVKRLR